jgi:cysteinyl-tRNA synthetase
MKLYDTQSRLLKETPSASGNLAMYCCGPTVYRDAHVGNLRTFMLADLISRVVALSGVKVTLIQNITDVGHMSEDFAEDDKILFQATLDIDMNTTMTVPKSFTQIGHYGKQLVSGAK